MKAIKVNVILGSVRSRKDGSLGLTLETPALSSAEKAAVFDLQNLSCEMLLNPIDTSDDCELVTINTDLNMKSPSQRLRSVLFVLYRQLNSLDSFQEFYVKQMEKMIEHFKSKLNKGEGYDNK